MIAAPNLLRARTGHESGRVTYVELFFDLVFVFAITQLSHTLLEHLTWLGAAQTALLLMAVWWVWIDTAWVTNWLDPERPPVRLMLFALMLAGLVLSTSIPKAFGERGLAFACAYAAMQVGRCLFMLWTLKRHRPGNYRNFIRITTWLGAASVVWVAGGLAGGDLRFGLWLAALAIETSAPAAGYYVPGLGRSTTADWDIAGGHIAERCALFIIVALGESVVVTGATFSNLAWTDAAVAAFAVSFVGSVAMWWIYFNIGAERGSRHIAASEDPGRMARVYTYVHVLIVAAIILAAVADELVLSHPGGHLKAKAAIVILAGPALFLVSNALFKRQSAQWLPLSHLVGLGLLAVLVPAVPFLTPLWLSAATVAVLVIVAAWESISLSPARR